MVESSHTRYLDELGISILDSNSVIGSDIFQKLKSSFLKSRFFPATLFISSDIIEATSFCWQVARMIYCDIHTGCGSCHGCRVFDEGENSDFLCISSVGSLKIEDSKKLMDHFSLSPSYNSYRVAFIHQADTLTISAMNSVLKILEELPSRCYCLMSARSSVKILPTILSRCMSINVNRTVSCDLARVYPFLTEDLLNLVKQRIKACLTGNSSKIDVLSLEETLSNCASLSPEELYSTIQIALADLLKSSDFIPDSHKFEEFMDRLGWIGTSVRLNSSINSRLVAEGVLL